MWNQTPPGSVPNGLQANEKGDVDWGALAQAWIQNKSEKEKNQYPGESASNEKNVWRDPSVFHSGYYCKNWNVGVHNQWYPTTNQPYHQPGNVAIAPLPPPPPVPPPIPDDVWEPKTNAMENMPSMPEHRNTIEVPQNLNKWLPDEAPRYQIESTPPVEEKFSKKVLPAWIREGLEKIGKTNPTKEHSTSKTEVKTANFLAEETEKKINSADEEESDESDAELPQENGSVSENLEMPEVAESQEDLITRVRKWLTRILLEVTEAEITDIAVNTFKQCSKAPAKPLIQSSALSSICDTGLVAGYSSDEEVTSEEEDNEEDADIDQHSLQKKIDAFKAIQQERLENLGLETNDATNQCSSDHKDVVHATRHNNDKENKEKEDLLSEEDNSSSHLSEASNLEETMQSRHPLSTERNEKKHNTNTDHSDRSPTSSKTRTHKKRKHSKKSHHTSSKRDRKSPHKKSRRE